MERRVHYLRVDESREAAVENALTVMRHTYSTDKVRVGQVVDATLIEHGRNLHPETHRPLPEGMSCYDIEAWVPGGLRGWDDTNADDAPLPPGMTRVR